jgi:hypothetical protein
MSAGKRIAAKIIVRHVGKKFLACVRIGSSEKECRSASNPRHAISGALRDVADHIRQRSGKYAGFAGYSKVNRKTRRTARKSKRS